MDNIKLIVEEQINNLLCFKINVDKYIGEAVERTKKALIPRSDKYLNNCEGSISFSIYNSAQYCIFLYNLSRVMYETDNNGTNAEKVYYLNKILNSVDLFYAIKLPEIWGVEHPLGSVMGRAEYGNRFFFYQGCTVGGNGRAYPKLGKNVIMYSNSKILGDSKIGDNVLISANTYIKDQDIPCNCMVFGQTPNLIIKQKTQSEIIQRSSHIWKTNIL